MTLDQETIDAIATAVVARISASESPAWQPPGRAAALLGISDFKLRKQHTRLRLGTDYRVAQVGRGEFEYHVGNCRSKLSA
jgi:hypothetical protein